MRLDIQSRGFELTDGLRQHTEQRLRAALGWAHSVVHKVVVRMSDINGPRGGRGNLCHVQVALRSAPNVVIEDTESDLYVAIDRAVDRAGRSVARRMDRSRQQRRGFSMRAASRDVLATADLQTV